MFPNRERETQGRSKVLKTKEKLRKKLKKFLQSLQQIERNTPTHFRGYCFLVFFFFLEWLLCFWKQSITCEISHRVLHRYIRKLEKNNLMFKHSFRADCWEVALMRRSWETCWAGWPWASCPWSQGGQWYPREKGGQHVKGDDPALYSALVSLQFWAPQEGGTGPTEHLLTLVYAQDYVKIKTEISKKIIKTEDWKLRGHKMFRL